MGEHSAIGRRQPRIDGVEKVTGAAEFTEDIFLPNILTGKVLRSRFAHARILSIDTAKAETLPGVKAIITYRDIPNNQDVLGVTVGDQPILAETEVRHLGDPVAAVAAVDEATAERALRLIQVEYEELPAVFDPEEAMKRESPRAHLGVESNIVARRSVRHGDIQVGFRQADAIFEDRFQTQGVDHAPLETDIAMVRFEPDGTLTVWAPTQAPFQERVILSRSLGIPHHKIRVIVPHIGGGFGGKMAVHVLYLTAVLAKKAEIGKPVRMAHTREEDLYCSTIRHPAIVYLKTGLKRDGTITARQCTFILDMGAYVHYGDLVTQWVGQTFAGVYRTPHLSYDGPP
ncbi:MAG: molybdopterin-dependent oxidoreductase, partial [Chloroflexi bacterium]|nr:molybdopterin-dependent oxidoreductase [Chloroflexota bacterium]